MMCNEYTSKNMILVCLQMIGVLRYAPKNYTVGEHDVWPINYLGVP